MLKLRTNIGPVDLYWHPPQDGLVLRSEEPSGTPVNFRHTHNGAITDYVNAAALTNLSDMSE